MVIRRRALLVLLVAILPATLLLPWPSPAAPPASTRVTSPLTLPAALPAASGYVTEDAFPGLRFSFPLAIASPPGEKDRLFVVEKTGSIQLITHLSAKPRKSTFLDLPAILKAHNVGTLLQQSEWGLLGMAFHPDFAQNGQLYITYDFSSPDPDGSTKSYNRLSRFTVSKTDPDLVDPDSEAPLITQLDHAGNHDGGDVHFGPDGYLYYSMGDEGNANDSFNNASFIDKDFFAAIYRLDVDSKATSLDPNPHRQKSQQFPSAVHKGAYKIPADNPFIKARSHHGQALDPAKIRTEVFICGLRNPWRFSFDPATGRLFIGDVGQNAWEMVHLAAAGADCGWPFFEGDQPGPRFRDKPADTKFTAPIYVYRHGNGSPFTGNSVTGGVIYRGTRITELFGSYIFADYGSRHLWALRQNPAGKWVAALLANGPDITAFGLDPRDGDLLMTHFGGGRIERLKRTSTTGDEPQALLSQTHAFKDLATLTPNPGVVRYSLNVPFWSDHAAKSRWFSLPTADDQIAFSPAGNYEFPKGTIFVKHFDLETAPGRTRRLETRFIVKTANSVYGITYKWRPDNSDADLVPENGLDEPIEIRSAAATRTQTWHYPARSECLSCHTDIAGQVLGFNTAQLNMPPSKTTPVNQLVAFANAGYLKVADGKLPDPKTLPAYARADDAAQSLEARARSYLAVNCTSCHQPGGPQSNWDARLATKTADLLAVQLQDQRHDPAMTFITPGDPAHSMLLHRLKTPAARMPPLATTELDEASIDLLTQWIRSLPK